MSGKVLGFRARVGLWRSLEKAKSFDYQPSIPFEARHSGILLGHARPTRHSEVSPRQNTIALETQYRNDSLPQLKGCKEKGLKATGKVDLVIVVEGQASIDIF